MPYQQLHPTLATPLIHDRLEHNDNAPGRQRAGIGTEGDCLMFDPGTIGQPHCDMTLADDTRRDDNELAIELRLWECLPPRPAITQ